MTHERTATPNATHRSADVLVIGDGVIGLSTAWELGRAGVRCHVFCVRHDGAASGAAAGLLAPSIGHAPAAARPLLDESLALYPEFVARLAEFDADLRIIAGLVDVSSRVGTEPIQPAGTRLSSEELSRLEPELAAEHGCVWYPVDGAIDNVRLVAALRRAAESLPTVTFSADDPVTRLELDVSAPGVVTRGGRRMSASSVILAAGAWSSAIEGLPRLLPVFPLKGQMLAVASTALGHSVMSDDVYLVPRGGEVAIGATVEHAGFDLGITPTAIERLRQSAVQICPSLADAPVTRRWAGIRPATADMLPILGRDPETPTLLYACGHSKNGILLAPVTAVATAALVTGVGRQADLGQFSITRFAIE